MSSMARGIALDHADQVQVVAERTRLQSAHVEQVLHQPDQLVHRLLSCRQQLVAVSVGECDVGVRRLVTAAFAEANGVRRS
jgi:hypothetical protein